MLTCLENISPADNPHLEQNLMSLPEFALEKIVKLQKSNTFYKKILEHIHCSKNNNYFTYAMGTIDSNSIFSAVVIPQILIKRLLQTSHNSLGYTGAMKLYHFIKRLYCFQGMRKKIQYIRLCHKCQIINLQKHQDIAQTPHNHISIDLLGPYNVT